MLHRDSDAPFFRVCVVGCVFIQRSGLVTKVVDISRNDDRGISGFCCCDHLRRDCWNCAFPIVISWRVQAVDDHICALGCGDHIIGFSIKLTDLPPRIPKGFGGAAADFS